MSLLEGVGPGHLIPALKDLSILGIEVNDDQVRGYNESTLCIINSIVAPETRDGEWYLDPSTNSKVQVNHRTLDIMHSEEYSSDEDVNEEMRQYFAEHYPDSKHVIMGNTLLLSKTLLRVSNFWSGRWTARYELTKGFKGVIEVDVHYYENGNVRLLVSKEIDAKDLHELSRLEREFQESLGRRLSGFGENEFKDLRRALPVTRAKVNWQHAMTGLSGRSIAKS